MLTFGQTEQEFFNKHPNGVVIGIDEAARGTLIGNMHAAAVALTYDGFKHVKEVAIDSKATKTPARRQSIQKIILQYAKTANTSISVKKINSGINLDELNFLAMQTVLDDVLQQVSAEDILILCDSTRLPPKFKGEVVSTTIKGETFHVSIASASILAKHAFDDEISQLHAKYPRYKFLEHSGYATKSHLGKIRTLGYLPEHRIVYKTFKGMKPNTQFNNKETINNE